MLISQIQNPKNSPWEIIKIQIKKLHPQCNLNKKKLCKSLHLTHDANRNKYKKRFLSLTRFRDTANTFDASSKRYVITNPPSDFNLLPTDQVGFLFLFFLFFYFSGLWHELDKGLILVRMKKFNEKLGVSIKVRLTISVWQVPFQGNKIKAIINH